MECAPYLIEERKSLKLTITIFLSKNLPEMKFFFPANPNTTLQCITHRYIYPSTMTFVGLSVALCHFMLGVLINAFVIIVPYNSHSKLL